ncbi:MAG TPA: Dps family protein [Salinivirga sp.]|uniref:Dps family protein n=1 Tax=Salinivirga sp. TaxID=1970192 RepID=UPI002B48EC81|nr:Dps family protein [Salinivirga sp.]HKK57830.1 Dps family protein [Salinivirga sp.]
MNQLEIIGHKEEDTKKIALKLNELLADYHMFYMNLRGLHWNIKGPQFFALHNKFEELYDNAAEKIDEIAERILSIGETPVHSLSEYTKKSGLKEELNVSEAAAAIEVVLNGFKYLLAQQKEILELADELDDEATNAMMGDYISEQEKLAWMFHSTTR